MPEFLLTPSSIKLFGRVVSSLQYTDDTATLANNLGNNLFLQRQLSVTSSGLSFVGSLPAAGGRPREITVTVAAPNPGLSPGMLVTGLTAAVLGAPADGESTLANPSAQILPPGTYIVSTNLAPAGAAAPGTGTIIVSAAPSIPILGQTGCSFTALAPPVTLARICAFSFEGTYYGLPRPPL